MNDSNFEAEFILPEDLQRQLDEISEKMTTFVVGTMLILYPDGVIPENAMQEVVNLLVPKVKEGMAKAVNKFLEELG